MKLILKHISPWFIIWIARVTEGHSTEGLPADRFTATRESAYTVRKDGVATELVLKQEFYDQEGREVQWGGHLSRPSERHRITIVDKAGADGKARVLVDHDSPYSIFDWYTICHVHVDGYQLYLVRFGQQMAGAGVSVLIYDLTEEPAEKPEFDSTWFPRMGSGNAIRLLNETIRTPMNRWKTTSTLENNRLMCIIEGDGGPVRFVFDLEKREWSITEPDFEMRPDPQRPDPAARGNQDNGTALQQAQLEHALAPSALTSSSG